MAHPRREGIAYLLPLLINSLTLNCPNRVDLAASVRSVPALDGLGSVRCSHSGPRSVADLGWQQKALAEQFAAITALTDDFCAQHLNDEYRQVIHSLVGTLARKRPSPLLKGKESIWAAAVVHTIGRINFLDDPAQTPHCKRTVIFEFFGVVESTGQTKSREIQKLLDVGPLSPEWTVPSRLADNPIVWMLEVDGLMMDMRHAPVELQRAAFEQGLIPFVPGEQSDKSG